MPDLSTMHSAPVSAPAPAPPAVRHSQLDQSPSSRRREQQAMNSEKRDKQLAISRVREVVKNVSNNDILLALHDNDGCPEKTIHALTERGASAVLDSWQSTGASSKNKRNRNKNKPNANGDGVGKAQTVVNGAGNAGLGAGLTNDYVAQTQAVTSHMQATSAPAHTPAPNNRHAQPSTMPPAFHVPPQAPVPQRHPRSNGVGPAVPSATVNGYGHSPPAKTQSKAPVSVSYSHGHSNSNGQHAASPDHDVTELMSADPATRKKAIAKEVAKLSKHDAVTERVQSRFNEELHKANDRARRAFNELRQLLNDREQQTYAELDACKQEGLRVLAERAQQAKHLHTRSQQVVQMNDRDLNELRNDIKHFVSERKYEEELGSTVRFVYEPDTITDQLKHFGHVVGVKQQVHKHSSHSSLVSSVGEDSGLGMLSPVVSPAAAEPKKPMASVECGGIVMKSESLSSDQLEDLNRRLRESLAAQGMSTDMLSGVSSGNTGLVSARRRPPPGGRGGFQGGPRNNRFNNNRGRNQPPAPQLSILENGK